MPIFLVLPGFSSMVPIARMAVRHLLPDCPRGDDVELIVSELATNAVRHSTSRGDQFELRLDIEPGHLRIEVKDGGPFGFPPPAPPKAPAYPVQPWTALYEEDRHRDRAAEVEEYAHGLTVIDACCDDWGHDRYPDHAIWWAELAWPEPADPAPEPADPERAPLPADPEPESAPELIDPVPAPALMPEPVPKPDAAAASNAVPASGPNAAVDVNPVVVPGLGPVPGSAPVPDPAADA